MFTAYKVFLDLENQIHVKMSKCENVKLAVEITLVHFANFINAVQQHITILPE